MLAEPVDLLILLQSQCEYKRDLDCIDRGQVNDPKLRGVRAG